jgi:hypothetical protein
MEEVQSKEGKNEALLLDLFSFFCRDACSVLK